MMAAQPFPILPDDAKAVHVALTRFQPIDELNAELERALGTPHELGFVELDQLIVLLDGWDGCFANSNGPDGFTLDQIDVVQTLEQLAEQRCGHPTRSAAANDENSSHDICGLTSSGATDHDWRTFRQLAHHGTVG